MLLFISYSYILIFLLLTPDLTDLELLESIESDGIDLNDWKSSFCYGANANCVGVL